jgi:4-aminobutyrate aminotransferase-like enzyme
MLPEIVSERVPGPRSGALAAELKRYECRNVTFVSDAWPVFWERADGVNVWDADGNRFLDLTSAFGVSSLGHGNADILRAATRQLESIAHAMGDVHPVEGKVELLRRLSVATFERWGFGKAKSILCNSGFESIEAALKTSILHTGMEGVLAFENAYHGLGFGALAASGLPYFSAPFVRQLPAITHRVPFPACYRCPWDEKSGYRLEGSGFPNCSSRCIEELEDRIEETLKRHSIGCILTEPIQGRGGEIIPPRDFLRLLRAICDRHKILLIVDEIYTGWNRTGKLFACDHSEVIPDIICVGKAMTGFFPMSACIGRADIMNAWPESNGEALHTSTFLGNPVGCAAAIASIDIHLRPETARLVRERGDHLAERLRALRSPLVGDVRIAGLLAGIELVNPGSHDPNPDAARRIVSLALNSGVLLLAGGASGNVLSITPPFAITFEELDWACARIQEYLTSL